MVKLDKKLNKLIGYRKDAQFATFGVLNEISDWLSEIFDVQKKNAEKI